MFCLKCGSNLTLRRIDNRERNICNKCGWIYYPQLKVGSAAILTINNKILLLKRAEHPWKDDWYLPAGYVEFDEDPIKAVIREVYEETGIIVNIENLFNVYFFNDDPRGNGVLIVYQCSYKSGDLKLNNEVIDGNFFKSNQLPKNLCGAGHSRAILDWKRKVNE